MTQTQAAPPLASTIPQNSSTAEHLHQQQQQQKKRKKASGQPIIQHPNTSVHQQFTIRWAHERAEIVAYWHSLPADKRKEIITIDKIELLQKMKDKSRENLCHCDACSRRRMFLDDELELVYDNFYKQLLFSHRPLDTPPVQFTTSNNNAKKEKNPSSAQIDRAPVDPLINLSWEDLDEHFDFTLSPLGDGRLTVCDELVAGDCSKFLTMIEHLSLQDLVDFDDDDETDSYVETEDGESDNDFSEDEFALTDTDDCDSTTSEERMEESRRMFQIFSAKIFEERLIQSYLEKVADDHKEQFLEELKEEAEREKQQELKKKIKRANQKERKKMEKQMREAEKLKKEQERSAEEEAQRRKEEEERLERLRIENERKVMERKDLEQKMLMEKMEREKEKLEQVKKERERLLQIKREMEDAAIAAAIEAEAAQKKTNKKKSKKKKKKGQQRSALTTEGSAEDNSSDDDITAINNGYVQKSITVQETANMTPLVPIYQRLTDKEIFVTSSSAPQSPVEPLSRSFEGRQSVSHFSSPIHGGPPMNTKLQDFISVPEYHGMKSQSPFDMNSNNHALTPPPGFAPSPILTQPHSQHIPTNMLDKRIHEPISSPPSASAILLNDSNNPVGYHHQHFMNGIGNLPGGYLPAIQKSMMQSFEQAIYPSLSQQQGQQKNTIPPIGHRPTSNLSTSIVSSGSQKQDSGLVPILRPLTNGTSLFTSIFPHQASGKHSQTSNMYAASPMPISSLFGTGGVNCGGSQGTGQSSTTMNNSNSNGSGQSTPW